MAAEGFLVFVWQGEGMPEPLSCDLEISKFLVSSSSNFFVFLLIKISWERKNFEYLVAISFFLLFPGGGWGRGGK